MSHPLQLTPLVLTYVSQTLRFGHILGESNAVVGSFVPNNLHTRDLLFFLPQLVSSEFAKNQCMHTSQVHHNMGKGLPLDIGP